LSKAINIYKQFQGILLTKIVRMIETALNQVHTTIENVNDHEDNRFLDFD